MANNLNVLDGIYQRILGPPNCEQNYFLDDNEKKVVSFADHVVCIVDNEVVEVLLIELPPINYSSELYSFFKKQLDEGAKKVQVLPEFLVGASVVKFKDEMLLTYDKEGREVVKDVINKEFDFIFSQDSHDKFYKIIRRDFYSSVAEETSEDIFNDEKLLSKFVKSRVIAWQWVAADIRRNDLCDYTDLNRYFLHIAENYKLKVQNELNTMFKVDCKNHPFKKFTVYRGGSVFELERVKRIKIGRPAFTLYNVNNLYNFAVSGSGLYTTRSIEIAKMFGSGIAISKSINTVESFLNDGGVVLKIVTKTETSDSYCLNKIQTETDKDLLLLMEEKKVFCPSIAAFSDTMMNEYAQFIILNPAFIENIKAYDCNMITKLHVKFTKDEICKYKMEPKTINRSRLLVWKELLVFQSNVFDEMDFGSVDFGSVKYTITCLRCGTAKVETSDVGYEYKFYIMSKMPKSGVKDVRVKPIKLTNGFNFEYFKLSQGIEFAVQYARPKQLSDQLVDGNKIIEEPLFEASLGDNSSDDSDDVLFGDGKGSQASGVFSSLNISGSDDKTTASTLKEDSIRTYSTSTEGEKANGSNELSLASFLTKDDRDTKPKNSDMAIRSKGAGVAPVMSDSEAEKFVENLINYELDFKFEQEWHYVIYSVIKEDFAIQIEDLERAGDRWKNKELLGVFVRKRTTAWQYVCACNYNKDLHMCEHLLDVALNYNTSLQKTFDKSFPMERWCNNSESLTTYRGGSYRELEKVQKIKLGQRAFTLFNIHRDNIDEELEPGLRTFFNRGEASVYAEKKGDSCRENIVAKKSSDGRGDGIVLKIRTKKATKDLYCLQSTSNKLLDVDLKDMKAERIFCPAIAAYRGTSVLVILAPAFIENIKAYDCNMQTKIHVAFTENEILRYKMKFKTKNIDVEVNYHKLFEFQASVFDAVDSRTMKKTISCYKCMDSDGEYEYKFYIVVEPFYFGFSFEFIDAVRVKPMKLDINIDEKNIGSLQQVAFAIQYAHPNLECDQLKERSLADSGGAVFLGRAGCSLEGAVGGSDISVANTSGSDLRIGDNLSEWLRVNKKLSD